MPTAMPLITDLTGAAVSESGFKTQLTNLFAALREGGDPLGRFGDIQNLGLAFSVGSNALTCAVKQRDGSTNADATNVIQVPMRHATASNGSFNVRNITAALSLTISSGSTLGHANATLSNIYWYLIDNAGTLELAASTKFFGGYGIVSTTAEGGAGAADSATVMYSATARTNVPYACIGRSKDTQTTAGTWTAVPSTVELFPLIGTVGALGFGANVKDDGAGNLVTYLTTEGTIASATTTDLGTLTTNIATITGTTTITGLGSSASAANPLYFVRFTGALTLTHNATSLILPGAANITTVAGDSAIMLYLGSGNWKCLFYQPISGEAVSMAGTTTNLASASTTNLGSLGVNSVAITGTTTITAFGSSASIANPIYFIRFTGALTLTHNATSLILPGSANITTAAGDGAIMEYLGSGNWRCVNYQKADGTAIAGATGALTGITSINGGELAGFRNFLYNPFFDVWQRGTSFTPAASTVTYLADRWFGYRATDTAWTVSQQTALAGYSQYGMKVQRNNGSATTNQIRVGQVLPTIDVLKYAGKTCRLSLYLKAGANFSAASSQVTVDVKNGTGTDEGVASLIAATWTGSNTIFSTAQAITTTITRYDFACAIPANAKELAVQVLFTPVGTAGADDSVTIEAAQLEPGTVATPPEIRPFPIELAMCQRFYAKTFDYSVAPAQNAGRLGVITGTGIGGGGNTQMGWRFPVQMRTSSQTITTYNPNAANANVRDFSGGSDVAVSLDPNTIKSRDCISVGSLVSGQAMWGVHVTADAEL
ncbi:MAG: hypothetical protein SFX19_10190 [Alphaproteobacteria bacterium]|nr:hypothetical protein [Alphaproteobacteria bacterium]